MSNRLTRGKALLGDVVLASGKMIHVASATVARTDTSAKNLFTLPANAVITRLAIFSATVSNAGTTATLSVGKSGGTGIEFLNGFDVKGATGAQQVAPTAAVIGSVGTTDVVVTGVYAETGSASSAGGPWTVIAEYTTV